MGATITKVLMRTTNNQLSVAVLSKMLHEAHTRTLAYAHSLQPEQWLGPYLKIVNPPLWELGHLAWFQEHWCLRCQPDGSLLPSMLEGADALYNSAIVPHAQRWHLPLPAMEQTLTYLNDVLDAVLARMQREGATSHISYFVQLAVFHEEMHNEAFDYTAQTLAYSRKKVSPEPPFQISSYGGDAQISGGNFMLGAQPDNGFAFDNEKWAHPVEVKAYQMARTAVTNAEFAAFVDDGGYTRRELWSDDGWDWRLQSNATLPMYWKKQGGQWLKRRYEQWLPLVPSAAVIHVNWFEAQAYCRWAGRRLPTEAEWEFAAATAPHNLTQKRHYPWGDAPPEKAHANLFNVAADAVDVAAFANGDSAWGVRQMLGNVWEWTADWFNPYPGFVRDPYREYSEPWFGTHKVLRGGCYATRASLLRNTWRNFYTPDRRDVLAGFRTCALD